LITPLTLPMQQPAAEALATVNRLSQLALLRIGRAGFSVAVGSCGAAVHSSCSRPAHTGSAMAALRPAAKISGSTEFRTLAALTQ
jgi:hypothetical protein